MAEAADTRAPVTVLDQALWRDLQQDTDEAAFGSGWLGLTCRQLPGAIGGVLLLSDGRGGFRASANWPDGSGISPSLARAAQAAADAGRAVVQPPEPGQSATSIALPLLIDGRVAAIAGLDATLAPPGRDARFVMRHLQWAGAWVRERLQTARVARQAAEAARLEVAVDLLAATLEQTALLPACRTAATEIAGRLMCERVAIGFVRRGRSKVAAISHSAAFGQRMTLTRLIEAAMDESIDQHAPVLVPPPADGPLVTAAHAALAAQHAPATVLTLPMMAGETLIGAITFERPVSQPFAQNEIEVAEAVAAILGPAFADKRAAGRWIVPQLGDLLARHARRLFGPRYLGRKLLVLAALGLVAAGYWVRIPYEVHAQARITGSVRRSVVAPFDGFLREAPLQAGDTAHAGDLLAAFDDRDLVLDRLRWVTERQVHTGEYDEALSAGKRADAVRLRSQIAAADAQIRLADEQLARTRLVAPFEGLIVSGDMTQSIGAPVRRGDVLFELAPLDDYRVDLQVGEGQVADVVRDQPGQLVLAALPGQVFGLAVERVTPVADAKDGAVTFRAEARLLEGSARLRPGMEGVARVRVGEARAVWVWTRPFLHWLRLATWSWWP